MLHVVTALGQCFRIKLSPVPVQLPCFVWEGPLTDGQSGKTRKEIPWILSIGSNWKPKYSKSQ